MCVCVWVFSQVAGWFIRLELFPLGFSYGTCLGPVCAVQADELARLAPPEALGALQTFVFVNCPTCHAQLVTRTLVVPSHPFPAIPLGF